MLESLRALATMLTGGSLTVDEIVARLGTVNHDYGANVLVAPRDAAFREVNVVRAIDLATRERTNRPNHLTLVPAEPPSLEALEQEFGSYSLIPAEENVPPQAIFYLAMPGQPNDVALIAEVKDGRATSLTLRPDPR